jgi:hypothetical protein
MKTRLACLLLACVSICPSGVALSQQNVHIETPVQRLNDSFYEYFGTDWGFQRGGRGGGGPFFNNGGFGPPPAFGGYPGGGATFGIGGRGFRFNMIAAQGSRRSNVVNSPSITMIPGTSGSVQDLTYRPFVTGIVPIVGSPFNRSVIPMRPDWDAGKVRAHVDQLHRERDLELRREERQAVQGPPLTKQADDPPLLLK